MIKSKTGLFLFILLLVGAGRAWATSAIAQDAANGSGQGNTIFLPLVQQAGFAQAAVDPRVLEDTANGQTGHFVVVMKQQAQVQAVASAAPE